MQDYTTTFSPGYGDLTNPNQQSQADQSNKPAVNWGQIITTTLGVFGTLLSPQSHTITSPGGTQNQNQITANYKAEPPADNKMIFIYGGIALVVVAILFVVLNKK